MEQSKSLQIVHCGPRASILVPVSDVKYLSSVSFCYALQKALLLLSKCMAEGCEKNHSLPYSLTMPTSSKPMDSRMTSESGVLKDENQRASVIAMAESM